MRIHAAPAIKHKLSTSESVRAIHSRGCRAAPRVTADAKVTASDPRSCRAEGRCGRVGGEHRGNAIAFVCLETPVGKGSEVEKPGRFILGCISRATPLPYGAVGRTAHPFFRVRIILAHRNALLYLRPPHRCHP